MNKYSYLIAGNGRLSKHFQHYFNSIGVSYRVWSRNSDLDFNELAESASRVLVLIKDDEIESFIKKNKTGEIKNKIWIHCSGILTTPHAESAHPLMTFGNDLYDLDTYRNLTFITEKERLPLKVLFPELENRSYSIPSQLKNLYHAWCVMAGNFTTILWYNFFSTLKGTFEIPSEAAHHYLKKITDNLIADSTSALTGPFVRNDFDVINKHLLALENESFLKIYKSFLCVYEEKT